MSDENESKSNDEKGILLEVGTNEVEFLEFSVAGERYGVNVAKITQIVEWRGLTLSPVTNPKPGLLGSVIFRGKSISAYDLCGLLGHSPVTKPEDKRVFLAVEFNRRANGFVVDSVQGIERVSWSDFTPMTASAPFDEYPTVVGTVRLKDRLVLIIDFEAIMSQWDPSQSAERYSDNVSQNTGVDRANIKVLYCEDSPTVKRLTVNVLQNAGFKNIQTCPTGLDGLNYLKEMGPKAVDILLSDIEMPQMDGLTLCKTIKGDPALCKIPVIFFSSLISDQMKLKCDSVQGDACFSKPEVHNVADAIDNLYRKVQSLPSK